MHAHQHQTGRNITVATGTHAEHGGAAVGHDALQLYERERARLAFDLHDGPAQAVAAALLQVRLLQDGDPADEADGLGDLQGLLASALEEMYLLVEQLHCRVPENEGLAAQVAAFCARSSVPVALNIEGDEEGYSQSLHIAVCRVVQEALTNVARHANATAVRVDLVLGAEAVACTIQDDGHGFDPTAVSAASSARDRLGLDGMRERAALLGGECVIDSTPGKGTRVVLTVPVWRG